MKEGTKINRCMEEKKGIFENYIIIYRIKESMYQLIE